MSEYERGRRDEAERRRKQSNENWAMALWAVAALSVLVGLGRLGDGDPYSGLGMIAWAFIPGMIAQQLGKSQN